MKREIEGEIIMDDGGSPYIGLSIVLLIIVSGALLWIWRQKAMAAKRKKLTEEGIMSMVNEMNRAWCWTVKRR